MSTDLVATGRIVTEYVVSGHMHKLVTYVKDPTLILGTWNIKSRGSVVPDMVWSDAGAGLTQCIVQNISAATGSWGSQTLEVLTDGLFQPVASQIPADVMNAAAYVPASQVTVTLRDSAFKHIKFIMMEGLQLPPQHFLTITGGNALFDSLMAAYDPAGALATRPFMWQVGRANNHLNDNPFVSATITYNRKLRRMRGVA